MEKTGKISILGRKKEFKMEKIVEISILRRKREFKMEKIAKISILGIKREFKMEKIAKISILGIRRECTLHLQLVITKIAGSNSKIVISEKSILSNYPKLHKRGKKSKQ